jgi:hypothetical protein
LVWPSVLTPPERVAEAAAQQALRVGQGGFDRGGRVRVRPPAQVRLRRLKFAQPRASSGHHFVRQRDIVFQTFSERL